MTHRMMMLRPSPPAVLCLAAGALLLTTAAVDAQDRTADTGQTLQCDVGLPSTTLTALGGEAVVTWADLRRRGVTVSARGSGEISLVMFVFTIDDGRVVDRWRSAPFQVAGGSTLISGRYLPSAPQERVSAVTAAKERIDVDRLLEVSKSGEATSILPPPGQRGRTRVMFAIPADGASGSRSGALFVHTEPVTDG